MQPERVCQRTDPWTDLQSCDQEPIHIPGAIQGYGMLLGIDDGGTVTHVAGMLEGVVRGAEPLGRAIADAAPEVAAAMDALIPNRDPGFRVGDRAYVVRSHRNGQGVRILEVEPDTPAEVFPSEEVERVLASATVLETLEHATAALRDLTGYDRVLAYMFDPDLNGTVLAETRRAGVDSYLHQRFPASDIPPQAMRLYRRKRVRLIADADAEVQALWGLAGTVSPLDLSDADLRAVSPIHLEYLRNMGVSGTLVCTLMAEDEVLGMLACHHLEAKYLSPTMRRKAGVIAASAAARVCALREREQNARRVSSSRETARMLLDLTAEAASPDGLGTHIDRVRTLLDAEGAAIVSKGRVFTAGLVPTQGDILRIAERMRQIAPGDLQHTDRLGLLDPTFAHLDDRAAGVVRCSLAGEPGDAVLWFRPEVVRSETWAGNPSESVLSSDAPGKPLTPRSSFEAYIRRITGRSVAWERWELETADAVRGLVSNIAWRMRTLRELAEERARTNRELAEARDQALAASKAKSDFLANMSHEIRTPMTAILGFADLLAEDLRDGPAQAADAVRTIRLNAAHLLSLLNDILDVSKIEAGQMRVELVETRPVQIVEEVASMLRPRAVSKGLDLRVEYETAMPRRMLSDPTRLRQILVNLVGNAVKFTERGSVTIRAACDPDTWLLRLSVVDTGIGMTPEQLERVSRFDRFSQADESTTRLYGGTGLGLRISSLLAIMLGGGISIESEVGRGSTFVLTVGAGDIDGVEMVRVNEMSLPESRERAGEPVAGTDASGGKPLEGLRILLAEDGPDNQRLIGFLLERAGATVRIAENGARAVEAMVEVSGRGSAFDVILMDMQMPELDGYGATRRARELGISTPIVALTAHAMAGDRTRCLEAGCDEYLAKPVDREALIATCRRFGARRGGLRSAG